MPEDREDRNEPKPGIARREFMKRGAIAAGTAMWAAPVVQSFTSSAFAAPTRGTPGCNCQFCGESDFGVLFLCTPQDPADCDCLCKCGGADTPCDREDPCRGYTIDCVVVEDCPF